LDELGVYALAEQEHGAGVPEVVKAGIGGQSGTLE
jgi:hypothetical protein